VLIDIYKQAYFNRQFELKVVEAHKKGLIKAPIYLSIGTEHIPAILAEQKRYNNALVFPQHRCHSWLLSFGANPTAVAKEILGRSDGLNGGMGGSASLGDITHNVYPHDGMLGSQAPIAVGACMASGKRTYCHIADASAEEDYVLGALGMAATHQLPILFICEDNNLSILTEKKVRRSWNIVDVAESFGLDAFQIEDKVDHIQVALDSIRLPGLLNIHCERHYWHAGSGQDTAPKTDRIKEMEQMLRKDNNHQEEIDNIMALCRAENMWLWDQLLT
jgi:pyruvate dehydrogenase E1 component alpha subunit